MSKIVIVFTIQGQICGELVKTVYDTSDIKLRKPVLIVPQQTGAQFVPIAGMTETEEYTIPESALLFRGYHEAIMPVANKFRELFSDSGIQIATSLPA